MYLPFVIYFLVDSLIFLLFYALTNLVEKKITLNMNGNTYLRFTVAYAIGMLILYLLGASLSLWLHLFPVILAFLIRFRTANHSTNIPIGLLFILIQ